MRIFQMSVLGTRAWAGMFENLFFLLELLVQMLFFSEEITRTYDNAILFDV